MTLTFLLRKKKNVVQHYFKDEVKKLTKKLDKDEIDEIEYDDRIDMLYNSTQRLYNSDQKLFNERRAEIQKEQDSLYKAKKQSVNSSVVTLKDEYPNFSNSDLQRVKRHLVDGSIGSLFYNDDGTYKDEAATMLAMALYGNDVMQDLIEEASRIGESRERVKKWLKEEIKIREKVLLKEL